MILLLTQGLMVLMLALWLSIGVWDNIRHASVNGQFVEEVLEMRRLAEEYPDIYAEHAHRAIRSKSLQRGMFRFIVLAELLATGLLWLGTFAIFASLAGLADAETARALAMLGTLAFTMIWASFLVAGNFWCYWMCHEGTQHTHYKMTLWGIAVLILLTP